MPVHVVQSRPSVHANFDLYPLINRLRIILEFETDDYLCNQFLYLELPSSANNLSWTVTLSTVSYKSSFPASNRLLTRGVLINLAISSAM